MLHFEIEDKQFRPVKLIIGTQNELDMLECICDALVNDKCTVTAQEAAKQLKALIYTINEAQDK